MDHSTASTRPSTTKSSSHVETAYRTWEQIAGYFDGDGNVGLEKLKRLLHLRLRFVDTWRPQIEAIKIFFDSKGIRTGAIGRDNKRDQQAVYRLEVSAIESVLRAAKSMLPHAIKKAEDLRITIDYLEDRMTGNDALAAFNAEVVSGRRRGEVRVGEIPYTRSEGLLLSKRSNAAKARAARFVDIPEEIQASIRRDHSSRLGVIKLTKKYGFSQSVIRRVLRGD